MNFKNYRFLLCGLLILIIGLGLYLLFSGGHYNPQSLSQTQEIILYEIRLPRLLVALFTGALLGGAGLVLQVYFRNALAGPDILGISSGASLGIAVYFMLPMAMNFNLGKSFFALMGSLIVMMLLTTVMKLKIFHEKSSLVILGLLLGAFINSFISMIVYFSTSENVKNFYLWSMGSFQNVGFQELYFFVSVSLILMTFLFLFPKVLNLLQLGDNQAEGLGVEIKKVRVKIITLCSLIIAFITSFCGPVGFIGIVAPIISKMIIKSSDIKKLLPLTFLIGSFLALLAQSILISLPHSYLTLNSLLGFMGAPIICLYLFRGEFK